MENILKILPASIEEYIKKLDNIDKLTEIRLRVSKSVFVYYGLKEIKTDVVVTKEDLVTILKNVSSNSIYSVQQDINNGYITVEGGHRIGIVGEIVWLDNKIKNIKNISSMNIRIAHEYIGVSDVIIDKIVTTTGIKNTIIISPPMCVKPPY